MSVQAMSSVPDVAPVPSLLVGAPLSPGDAITPILDGPAIISPAAAAATGASFPTASPESPGAIILSGINGFLGVSEHGDASSKNTAPLHSVKTEPGTSPDSSALVPMSNGHSGLSSSFGNGLNSGFGAGLTSGLTSSLGAGLNPGLSLGPVGSLSSLGTPLITPAALNQSSAGFSSSLVSLGVAPHQPAASAWGLGAAALAAPTHPGGASTLASALSRQQKETRDLVLKRTGKIFVGGLSQQTGAEELRVYFESFGEVKEAFIKVDPVTNRGRGFGFVTFAEPDAIDRVMRNGPHILDEKVVDCKLAVPQNLTEHVPLNAGGKKVFVGGVPTQATEQDLLRYFGMFGSVEHVMLMQDKETGRHRGFGFVTFHEGAIADLVVVVKFHTLFERVMEVKEAQPKGALPKPPATPSSTSLTAANFLPATATSGWGYGGAQLSLTSALGLPYPSGSSSPSSASGASVSPPVIGNGLPYSYSGNLFGSSPTGALHDLGSQRNSLPTLPTSPAAFGMPIHFGNSASLTQSSTSNTWGSVPFTISNNCPSAQNSVIGAGRYLPYPMRRPAGSNASQMGFNGAAAAANAAAAAANAAAAVVAASSHPLLYSFPQ